MRPGATAGGLLVTVLLTGCGGPGTEPTGSTVTVTATHSTTETVTVAATQTVTVTATETLTLEAAPADGPTPTPQAGSADTTPAGSDGADFDLEWAHVCAGYIVEDIELVDERMVDGMGVGSALGFLADSFGCLADAGAPPGVDGAAYLAQVLTLQDFAEQAVAESVSDPMAAASRYSIIREQTPMVLDLLNDATGSNFQLP